MKKSGFIQWMLRYKEYSALKAENVIARINQLSDDVCSACSIMPVFANDTSSALAKWKMQVSKQRNFSSAEKKDLDLLRDYLEMIELTNVSYDVVGKSSLEKYCDVMKMSYSYKPVLILSIIQAHENGMAGSYEAVTNFFINYYKNRLQDGKIVEKKDSLFAKETIDVESAKKIIENDPIKAFKQAGVVNYVPITGYLDVTSEYLFEMDETEGIKATCYNRLDNYYNKLILSKEENPFEQLRMLLEQIESCELRDKCIAAFNRCYIKESSERLEETLDENKKNELIISDGDTRKVGKLVRETMGSLSQSGYRFGESMINECLSKEWSKSTLGLYYPLFRLYDETIPLEVQTRDHIGNSRYYSKVYIFGQTKVLLTSEWYKESKDRYIRWFNSILTLNC